MADALEQAATLEAGPIPGAYIAPHGGPVHVDALPVPDDGGRGWVMTRAETIHGSHFAFITPDAAERFADELRAAAARARLLV